MIDSKRDEQSGVYRQLSELLRRSRLPTVLSKNEAAHELGVKRTTLDRLIASGQLLAIHYEDGSHPRIPLSEVIRLVSQKLDEASRSPHGSAATAKQATRRPRGAGLKSVGAEIARLDAAMKKRGL